MNTGKPITLSAVSLAVVLAACEMAPVNTVAITAPPPPPARYGGAYWDEGRDRYTAVAGFAQLLRGNAEPGNFALNDVIRIAGETRGRDEFGRRAEYQQLVGAAAGMPKFSAAR